MAYAKFVKGQRLCAAHLNDALAEIRGEAKARQLQQRRAPALNQGHGLYQPFGSGPVNRVHFASGVIELQDLHVALPDGDLINVAHDRIPLARQETLAIDAGLAHRIGPLRTLGPNAIKLLQVEADGSVTWLIGAVTLAATPELAKAHAALLRVLHHHRGDLSRRFVGAADMAAALRPRQPLQPALVHLDCCLLALAGDRAPKPVPCQNSPVSAVCAYFERVAIGLPTLFIEPARPTLVWSPDFPRADGRPARRYHVDLRVAGWVGRSITLTLPNAGCEFRYSFCCSPTEAYGTWSYPQAVVGRDGLARFSLTIPPEAPVLRIHTEVDPASIAVA